MKAESCKGGKGRGFVEHVQVVQSKLLIYIFLDFDGGRFFFSFAITVCKFYEARACGALDGQGHEVRTGLDGERLGQRLKLSADLGPFRGVYCDEGRVLGLWNREVLHIKLNQIQSELGLPVSFRVLENYLQRARVLVGLESN